MDSQDTIVEGAEQISSLQELHKTIQVISIRGWIALFFAFVFVVIALVWAFVGKIPIAVDGKCILLEKGTGESVVYGFFPLYAGQQVVEGMKGYISLDTIDPNKYGKIEGAVLRIRPFPVSEGDEALEIIPSTSLRHYFTEGELPTIMVEIQPLKDGGKFKWTSANGPTFPIPNASVGDAQIILKTVRPISYVLPED